MEKIHTEECFVKLILETYLPDIYKNLNHGERPDLQSENSGVEVTSISYGYNFQDNYIGNCTKYIKRKIEDNNIAVIEPINDFDSVNGFIIDSIIKKLQKNYNHDNQLDLFIYCMNDYFIIDFDDNGYKKIFNNIKNISNNMFDNIYINTISSCMKNDSKYYIIRFNIKQNKIEKIQYDIEKIMKLFFQQYNEISSIYSNKKPLV